MRTLTTIAVLGLSSSLSAQDVRIDPDRVMHPKTPPTPAPLVMEEQYAVKPKEFATDYILPERRPGWKPEWNKYRSKPIKLPRGADNLYLSRRFL